MNDTTPKPATPVLEQLPGEPRRGAPTGLGLWARILLRAILVGLLWALTLPLTPIFLLSLLIWGYPPALLRPAQVLRYLRYAWTEQPDPPGLPLGHRAWLTLQIFRMVASAPLWGLAWQLDELLYGSALDAVEVRAPLIKISAARSGSTQMARYLEEDPSLVSPSVLQFIFPYLWLWRLAPVTLGRVFTRERVQALMHAQMPPEFMERHEGDFFRTDTFELCLYITHLNHLSTFLGARVFRDEFAPGVAAPWNRHLWEVVFVDTFDRIARKTLLYEGAARAEAGKRVFIKGHFLAAAEALERRYPDARFLTMIRDPSKRIKSAVNFLRANPVDPTLNEPPWAWIGPAIAEAETAYNLREMEWFTQEGGATRCVVRFKHYVRDLEGAMHQVYRECFDQETLPPHVPREHAPRRRTNYALNRELDQVGVDPEDFRARNAAFIQWCEGE